MENWRTLTINGGDEDKQKHIEDHVYTDDEKGMIGEIQNLLQKGGKISAGNEWRNDPGIGGHYYIEIDYEHATYTYRSEIPIFFIAHM
jgi:hypothetical protein